jgi:hypothetical protein
VGKNQQAGILSDILTILPGGVFIISIPITLIAGDFVDDWFEFGLDVFQEKSGSDEGEFSAEFSADLLMRVYTFIRLPPLLLSHSDVHSDQQPSVRQSDGRQDFAAVRDGLHRPRRRALCAVPPDVQGNCLPRRLHPRLRERLCVRGGRAA